MKHSESIPIKKSTKTFWLSHISIFWTFWTKNDSPRKKISILKCSVQNKFRNILNRCDKKIWTEFSDLVIGSLFWPFWPKNDRVPGKKFTRGKFFDFEIFSSKHLLKHSESIPTKKIWVCHVFGHFRLKKSYFWPFSDFSRLKSKNVFYKPQPSSERNILLWYIFSPFWPKTVKVQGKITWQRIFDFDISGLEYV